MSSGNILIIKRNGNGTYHVDKAVGGDVDFCSEIELVTEDSY